MCVCVEIAFFTGPPFMTASINLLQRFQAVNGLSHFNAGVHLLPLLLSSPAPTSHGGIRTSRYEVGHPAFLPVVTWGRYADTERCLRLLCACSAAPGELRRLLGFPSLQVTMGFGLGMALATLPIYVSFLADRADLAISMSAVMRHRFEHLGEHIGLGRGVCVVSRHLKRVVSHCVSVPALIRFLFLHVYCNTTILNSHIAYGLPQSFDPSPLSRWGPYRTRSSSSKLCRPPTQTTVRSEFSEGYSAQLRAVLYISAVALISTTLAWDINLKRARDMAGY
ncbi:hypothetical protein CDEST_10602 [Colletotrichum destructivum]|uniref:Uncharacterized protein n=1 Tax=Colletotrichum destructivum TaxID=34406 RepID=A0AAX4IQV8_9PEZI|nr:hypothetical protein CDEST_10602 [Colletotrichum destructivum]